MAIEQGSRIQLCGRFVARVAGQRVESAMPGPQGRLLFALLAVNRHRQIPRDEAIDALWESPRPRRRASR